MLGDLKTLTKQAKARQLTTVDALPVRIDPAQTMPEYMEIEAGGPQARNLITGYPGLVGEIREESPEVYWALAKIPEESRHRMLRDYRDDRASGDAILGGVLGAGAGLGLEHLIAKRLKGVGRGGALGAGAGFLGGAVLGGLLGSRSKPVILRDRDLDFYGMTSDDILGRE